jgi:pyruvate dehydrogenase E1 component beta subunit
MPEGPVPDGDYTIPFGVGAVKREGSDVTIAAVGYWVNAALGWAEDLAAEGIDAEVWDPRTLTPFDREGLVKSVKKTGALVIIDQAPKTFGSTGEFAISVAEAITPVPPMARLATLDSPIPSSPALLPAMYPSKDKLIAAVKDVLKRKG